MRATAATGAYEQALAQQMRVLAAVETQYKRMDGGQTTLVSSQGRLQAANDNVGKSFTLMGLELASVANHLRVGAEAAYAFSPAFREVVNGLAAPALRMASVALEAVAAGLVIGTNMVGAGLIRLGAAAATVFPAMSPVAAGVVSAGEAMARFNPTILGVAGSIVSRLIPALRILGAIQFAIDAWKLAGERIEEYNEISKKADGFSTDFYQRIRKGAEASTLGIDGLTKAIERLKSSMAATLGGSEAQKQLDALTKAGNFQGNTGVASFAAANNPEQQLRAVADLYRKASDANERLAGLSLVKTVLGPEVETNLRKNDDFLDDMIRKADELSKTQIVSDDQIARAVLLQTRYDAALKVLSERWQPFKEILTELGIKIHEGFTQDLTDLAAVSAGISKLYDKAVDLIGLSWDKLLSGMKNVTTLVDAAGNAYSIGEGSAAKTNPLATSAEPSAMDIARQKLRSGLLQPSQVLNARDETYSVRDSVIRDQSKALNDNKKAETEHKDALDRSMESIEKYIQVTEASARTVGHGVAEQQKAKTIAELTAAAMRDGKTDLEKYAAEWEKLGDRAGQAALGLAKARIQSQVDFGRQTSLLSPEDAQIAQQLRGLYPDVATALGSVEAAGLRTNTALSGLSSSLSGTMATGLTDIVDGTKSVGAGFGDMSRVVARAINEMIIKMLVIQPLMRGLQSLMGGPALPGTAGSPFYGPVATTVANANGNAFDQSNVIPFAKGGAFTNTIVDAPTLFKFAKGGALGEMGEAGPEAIMPLRRGADGRLGVSALSANVARLPSQRENSPSISFGDINITVPEGTSADSAEAIAASVKESMLQVVDERISYHSRARGMLNRAS